MLKAISPIDGRYAAKCEKLSEYFSEYALIKYRVWVELEYFKALVNKGIHQLSGVTKSDLSLLDQILQDFDKGEAQKIKEIERTTNHDVKAVEYYIKSKIKGTNLEKFEEFIHFGLTSQDINNTALPAMLRDALKEVYEVFLRTVIAHLKNSEEEYKTISLLARTHGQAASPTTLGKELRVFRERLEMQLDGLKTLKHYAKFGGATGNFNAHLVSYPEIDWKSFGDHFIENHLGLNRLQTTTQIDHYDHMAAIFDSLKRINTILIDMCRDLWTYISMDYFKQKTIAGEVGSSAMPHKVNPIDFENAEGNLGLANAIFNHLSNKLPISRLQRDLTDSTVIRNVGVPLAHTIIALQSITKGIGKLELNQPKIDEDLEANWAVVAEAIQNILRRESYPKPYEALKGLTRGKAKINKQIMHEFIDSLEISNSIKMELKAITPRNYVGYR